MKKLILIALAFVAIQATAQEKKLEHRKGNQKERVHKMNNYSPEQMATLQTKKMTLNLDLTEAQQKEIHKIFLANAKERKVRMDTHKKNKENSEHKKPNEQERFNKANKRLDKQIAHKKQMKAVLSKEQFEKYEKSTKHRQMKQRKQMKQRVKKQRSKRS